MRGLLLEHIGALLHVFVGVRTYRGSLMSLTETGAVISGDGYTTTIKIDSIDAFVVMDQEPTLTPEIDMTIEPGKTRYDILNEMMSESNIKEDAP